MTKIEPGGFFWNLKSEATRVGYVPALQRSLYSVADKYIQIRRIELIHLRREFLAPFDAARYSEYACRVATEKVLLAMRDAGKWKITDELLAGHRRGDRCLLSFVKRELAGYTWVNDSGRPELLPGLRLRIPGDYVYNFAGFTLPEFRGYGLQSYRHHQILNQPEWRGKKGMIGYVEHTNWSSKKGQSKSGYQKLDDLVLLGHGKRPFALFPEGLRRMGIQRLHD